MTSEMVYKPPPKRTNHTAKGKKSIADAQHRRKVERLVSSTGLSADEVEHKLEVGMGWCSRHGWKPWPRCLTCKSEQSQKARQKSRKKTAQSVIDDLRKQAPTLAGKVTTGAALTSGAQLDLFSVKRASR